MSRYKNDDNSREVFIFGKIDDTTAENVVKLIRQFNNEDDENAKTIKDYKRKTINVFIHSEGGIITAGLCIYDILKTSSTPVHTHAMGMAYSMGIILLQAGHKRFVYENTTIMYHELSSTTQASYKLEGIQLRTERLKDVQKKLDTIVTTRTKVKQSVLDDYRSRKAECSIDSDEAISLGFADKIKK